MRCTAKKNKKNLRRNSAVKPLYSHVTSDIIRELAGKMAAAGGEPSALNTSDELFKNFISEV